MALKNLPYKTLLSLIGDHLSTEEDLPTEKAIKQLLPATKRHYLDKSDLVLICRWKSPRAIRHIERNTEQTITKITKAAFKTRSERKKLELLTELKGVSVPMASSILMLTNPQRYGVIDIRVWQLLYKMGSVSKNAGGVGFDFKQWYRFLILIRYFAKKFNVKARDIERTLFYVHTLYQDGLLYKK